MGIIPFNYGGRREEIPKFEINSQSFTPEVMEGVIPQDPQKIVPLMTFEDNDIVFSDQYSDCCVGIVDIVNSTRVSATLPNSKIGKYYSIFLNSTSSILRNYDAKVVKNIGDSLLYYFPETTNSVSKEGFVKCLEAGLAMINAHHQINLKLYSVHLPSVNYRVSADYGKVAIAKSQNSSSEDIFGPPVNMCSKINCKASPNGLVIGGDMYQVVKELTDYRFVEVSGCGIGFKYQYPTYSVTRKNYQNKNIVSTAIENALLEIGTPTLETVIRALFNEHRCLIVDCYDRPEYLSNVLKELFGNSHIVVIKSIRKHLGEYALQWQISEFLMKLERL